MPPTVAYYAEVVELIVNGVETNNFGLDDHTATTGQMFDMGSVVAGDTIGFAIKVYESGILGAGPSYLVYSTPSLNSDHNNHIYSTHYTAGTGLSSSVPSGTYVGFEDAVVTSDFNYQDETYIFTNVGTQTSGGGSSVPEPASFAVVGVALLGLRALRRRAA